MLWWVFLQKNFWISSNPWIFMPRWSTENHTKIAAIFACDRVSKIKGLVTTVTSLGEPNNLSFPLFCTFHLLHLVGCSSLVTNMPHRCVVGGCSNVRSLENGIGLHKVPFYGDEGPEAKKRRKRWIDFVRLKCAQWEPSKNVVICSKHFKPDDFFLWYFTSLCPVVLGMICL